MAKDDVIIYRLHEETTSDPDLCLSVKIKPFMRIIPLNLAFFATMGAELVHKLQSFGIHTVQNSGRRKLLR